MENNLKSSKVSSISHDLIELSNKNDPLTNSSIATDLQEKKIGIRIIAENVEVLEPQLKEYDFQIIASSPENHFVEGFINPKLVTKLETLEKNGLMGVLPIYEPITNVGNTTSQADFVHESDRVRAALPTGYDGTGITVGVMSDSYDDLGGAAGDVASGDLPSGVNVLQDLGGDGIDEGRAMAQLIYDMAPDSDIAFSSVFFGEADFAQQIRDLADPAIGNSDVLVDDIIYFAEPFFQDGIVAQAVDDVVINDGVSYFSSAGNSASAAFESDNINMVGDAAIDAVVPFDGTYYDFNTGAGVDTTQGITLNPGQRIRFAFQWDDPFYTTSGVDTDIDLYLLNSAGTLVDQETSNNIANQTPFEFLDFTNTTGSTETFQLVISNFIGPNPGRIKYVNFGNVPSATEYPIDAPTIYGHSVAENAQAVAAVPWFDQDNPESFTSEGPSTILFEPDGTPKAIAEVRQTPDIAAIDGTNTTFFGSDIAQDGDLFPNFFGTSAAAPHAAAIAALMKEEDPSLTPDQIYTQLQNTAEDIGSPGFDNLTGNGLVNAYDAIFGSVIPASLDFSDDFEDGDLSIAYETNSSGAGRIQVTGDNNPIGTNHLTLDSAGEGNSSLNEVILNVDATGADNLELSFDQREFGDEDDSMSASFVGSENSDGVALSVDGNIWYRLVSLTGANSPSSYQTQTFDLSAVATANGLTLDSDFQIKFQQFDNFPISFDGMAFDNISVTGDLDGPTPGDDLLNGTPGDDVIDALAGNDTVSGLGGNDDLFGAAGNDSLLGGNGNDTLKGGNGIDTLKGGNNNDILNGGNGDDSLSGGSGNDTIRGLGDDDILVGNDGDDNLFGGAENDDLSGNDGIDILRGEAGADTLNGGADNDSLLGGGNADSLSGGSGNDALRGEEGPDILSGGSGIDSIFTGSARDTVVLAINLTTADRDVIRDFELGRDRLGVFNLAQVNNLSVTNNGANTSSIITNDNTGEQVASLIGITNITISDLDFVEV